MTTPLRVALAEVELRGHAALLPLTARVRAYSADRVSVSMIVLREDALRATGRYE